MSNFETNENIDQPSIYVGGGFGYNEARNNQTLGYISQLGYDTVPALPDTDATSTGFTIAMGGVRRQASAWNARRFISRPPVADREKFEIISDFQQQRAKELITMLEMRGGQPVNALFQSVDALSGGLALAERPDLFRSVVLAFPAGAVQKPPIGKAIVGLAESTVLGQRNHRKAGPENNFETDDYKQARRGAMAKGSVVPVSFAFSYQAPILSRLRRAEDAPGVSMVLGIHDVLTPAKPVLQGLLSPNDIDYVLVTDASHGINGRKDIMDEILELFPKMEALKSARKAGEPMPPLRERILFLGSISNAKRAEFKDLATAVDVRSRRME